MVAFASVEPPQQARQPNAAVLEHVEAAHQSIAAVKEEAQPPHYYWACRDREEDRSSDLCAEWKSADAAQSAAGAAWWLGIAGAFIAALTLYVALKAALYARDAANHTATGADEARRSANAAEKAVGETQRIGEAQTRAYLSIIGCNAMFRDAKLSIQPTIRNSGQSPALEVRWIGNASLMCVGAKQLRSGQTNPDYRTQTMDLPAQGDREALYYDCAGFGLSQPELAAFASGDQVALSATIVAWGKDVFGKRVEGRDDFIIIFHEAPTNLTEYTLTLGSRLNPEPAQ